MDKKSLNKIIAYSLLALVVASLAMYSYTASLLRAKTEAEIDSYRQMVEIQQEALERAYWKE